MGTAVNCGVSPDVITNNCSEFEEFAECVFIARIVSLGVFLQTHQR